MTDLPQALTALTEELTAVPAHPGRWICLLDGGSGSGKTTLATELVEWLVAHGRRAIRVSLDDCYPGWDGLAAGSAMVWQEILPHNRFLRWDWAHDRPGDWVQLPEDVDLVIEGCGAITPASVVAADFSVWLEVPTGVRKALALGRDGELFAPHWDRWAAQEQAHWETDHPRDLARLVLEPAVG